MSNTRALKAMTAGNCYYCGADKGLHHYQTMQCPAGGREAREGEKQEWMSLTYINNEFQTLRDAAPALLKENEDLKAELATVKEEHYKSLVFISNLGLVKGELLEALKESRSLLLSQFGLFGGGTPLNRTIDLMNAAIAKAEGKEG
jgi:hypothetical protein